MQAMSSSLQTLLLQQLAAAVIFVISAVIFVAAAVAEPNSSCVRSCGSLDIPYPFGTAEGCYLDSSFLITCTPTPFLRRSSIEVLNISLDGELRVSTLVARDCPLESDSNSNRSDTSLSFLNLREFAISYTKNVFTTVGCRTLGIIESLDYSDKNYTTGCVSVCDSIDGMVNGSCSGVGCCQTPIPNGINDFIVSLGRVNVSNNSNVSEISPCGFAFVVEEKAYNFSSLDLQNMQGREFVPLVLDWAVGNQTCEDAKKNTTGYACKAANSECYNSTNGPGYLCNCSSGYHGNAYLSGGCQDIDECENLYNDHGCAVNAICVNNLMGSYSCSCPKGYEGDGRKDGNGCSHKPSSKRNIIILLCIIIGLLVLLLGGCSVLLGLKRRKHLKLEGQYFQQNSGTVGMIAR